MSQGKEKVICALLVGVTVLLLHSTSAHAINFTFSIGNNGSLATGSFSAEDNAWSDQKIDITEVTALVVTNHLFPPGEFMLSALTDSLQTFLYMAGAGLQFSIFGTSGQNSYITLIGTVYNSYNENVRAKSSAGPVNLLESNESTTVLTNPEPSTLLLLITGLSIFAWRTRRRALSLRHLFHHA